MIYVAKDGQYLSSYDDLMAGKGTNNDAVIPFEAGKKYRIRVINMSSLSSKSRAWEVTNVYAGAQLLTLSQFRLG
jgi:iron transport multicopper oxidase